MSGGQRFRSLLLTSTWKNRANCWSVRQHPWEQCRPMGDGDWSTASGYGERDMQHAAQHAYTLHAYTLHTAR